MFNRRRLVLPLVLVGCLFTLQDSARAFVEALSEGGAPAQASPGTATSVATKSTHFLFTGLRSGVIKTSAGWNAKDFAVHVMNPNLEEITVTWKLISDDPSFIFRDGSVGTWSKTQKIPPLGAGSYNVYGPRIYQILDSTVEHMPVSPLTNFTGSVEFSSSSPFYAFSGKAFETVEATDSDPDQAWYKTWEGGSNVRPGAGYQIPAIWDKELQAFVIPYTIYWHNVREWQVGSHSTLTIKNNSGQTVAYSIKHNPDSYGRIRNPMLGCQATPYHPQTVVVTLEPGKELSTVLESLYGWPTDQTSYMEGVILIQPDPITAWKETSVASAATTTDTTFGFCESTGPLVSVSITSPVATVSGTVNFAATTYLSRGYMTDIVEFYIDGKLKATSRTSPYNLEWDTTSTPNGLHTLMVVAVGTDGWTSSHSATVRVSNTPGR